LLRSGKKEFLKLLQLLDVKQLKAHAHLPHKYYLAGCLSPK